MLELFDVPVDLRELGVLVLELGLPQRLEVAAGFLDSLFVAA